jgi:hypothetical protein
VAYVDYLGNVTRFAVELVNEERELTERSQSLLGEHGIASPTDEDLAPLLPVIRDALLQIVDGAAADAVSHLLKKYPPEMHLSDHDGAGLAHIHFARNATPTQRWIGQTVAATLAHVATGDPGLTLGRCAAAGCPNFFVDQSRNRTRRFCGNTCASRTTVAAFRARTRQP